MEPSRSNALGLARHIERWLGALAVWSFRRHKIVLLIAVVITGLSVVGARSLRMDTDLTHLLPDTFDSVRSLSELEDKSWGVGYVSIAIRGSDRTSRRRVAEELVPALTALPTIEYVDFKKPTDFFVDRAPYYLERRDLETIRDRIDERHMWEVRKRSPMFDLELEPLGEAPSLAFTDMRRRYEPTLRRAGSSLEEEESSAYLEGEDMLVLLAKPSRRSSDVSFNDRVVFDVEELIAKTDLSAYAEPPVLELSGRYKKKAEQKAQIEADLRLASMLALALIIAYLAFHFRRVSAIGLVLVPLVMGLSWTFGMTAVTFGSLNLLTGFIGALLLGVGVDHGIHLLARVDAERAHDGELHDVVRLAFGRTGRAVVAAASTTIFAFVGVAVSEFRAFREFGVIAAAGLLLIVVAYTTVLPALLGVRQRGASTYRAVVVSPFARVLPRWAPTFGWLGVLAAVASLASLPRAAFDYDFASLESADLPAFRLDREINHMLGRSQTPLLVLADGVAHERAITVALRERHDALGDQSAVQQVLSLDDLVPQNAADKAEAVGEIHTLLVDAKESWLNDDQKRQRKRLIAMTASRPFGRADLPEEVTRQFLGRDGVTSFVLVYPRVSLSDGAGVRRLASELRGVRLPDGRALTVAGEAMVLADVLDMVVAETPVVLGATLVLVLLVLLLMLGPALVVPCFVAALTTVLVTAGLMPSLGSRSTT